MIVDHRTYRIKPGHTAMHLKIYEQYGYAAQTRHLGQPVAYMFAEIADPEWQVYLQKLNESGLLLEQKTSIMIPTGFCPIKR